ncbi:MAG: DUF3825 domain-containing protein [Algicola sp.]|nr:DUF3825 domain-containing protein [Algicola sp.]
MQKTDILVHLVEAIEEKQNHEGWTDLALIGKPLNRKGVNYKALGFLKLRHLIEDFPNNIEIKIDTSFQVPVIYARVKNKTQEIVDIAPPERGKSRKRMSSNLMDWAYLGDYRQTISDLKNMALKERWYYKDFSPSNPYPILSSYLTYTFFRLTKEKGKVKTNERYAAFNTGLVNNLYEPIYALFEKNKIKGRQEWFFHEFCISGVGKAGKILARNFNPLPGRANYFKDVSEVIYDINAPEPQLNWTHIILDNVGRLPFEFLEDNKPKNFLLRDTTEMDTVEKKNYFQDLASAIENENKTFRAIKNRFSDSLDLALKRVQWNYKTAIPMYYPFMDKLSLLLPLSLIDDDIIDLALVVEKTKSGNYLGHTILPLVWAYGNARLVTRPDSDWLIAEEIGKQQIEDEDEEIDE